MLEGLNIFSWFWKWYVPCVGKFKIWRDKKIQSGAWRWHTIEWR
jgi:hypothetical protein